MKNDLDQLQNQVAKKLGWHLVKERPRAGSKELNKKGTLAGVFCLQVPYYLDHIEMAWEIVDYMWKRGWQFYLQSSCSKEGFSKSYLVSFRHHNFKMTQPFKRSEYVGGKAETPALAICIAFAKAELSK